MRITFVDHLLLDEASGIDPSSLQPNLGLISLIAVVEQAGHEATLYDPNLELYRERLTLDSGLYDAVARAVLVGAPDVVGLTALGCNFICTVQIARRLKKHRPDLPLLLGGPHASVLARNIAQDFPEFDVIVRHEAEDTLVPVLEALGCSAGSSFSAIPGLTYRMGDEVRETQGAPTVDDVDRLPFPAYSHYPIEELNLKALRVEAGRGCPFACTFCSTASFFGRRFRLKSAQRLRADLDELYKRYAISHFSLQHDLFTVNKTKVREFCDIVAGAGYTWSCSARVDCVDSELLQAMANAGCSSIYFGIETGSQRLQGAIKKRLNLALVRPILDEVTRLGMRATASFITGYPDEDGTDQQQTLRMVEECIRRYSSSVNTQLHLLTPEPGTELYNVHRHELLFDGHVSDFNFEPLTPEDSDVMRNAPSIFMTHYYYPGRIERSRHIIVTQIYRTLQKLGRATMRAVLEAVPEGLTGLCEGAELQLKEAGWRGADELLIGSLTREFGADHHFVSRARYLLATARLSARARQPGTYLSETKDSNRLVLSASVELLDHIHDCSGLLAADSDGDLPPLDGNSRVNLLLLSSAHRDVRVLRISDATLALVASFSLPQSVAEACSDMEALGASKADAHACIDKMADMGVLVPERALSHVEKVARPSDYRQNAASAEDKSRVRRSRRGLPVVSTDTSR